MPVVLLEDVITTGGSTLRAVESLRSVGAEIAGVVVIVDRLEGGAEAIAGAGLRPRLVLGSSGAVYGRPTALPLREDTPPGEVTHLYAATRQAAEQMAQLLAARHGLPLSVARIFNPVGPGLDERHLPSALAAQVADIVGVCARHGCPVIPYGTGTSLEGQVQALHGGVCIDLSQMNEVLEVNADLADRPEAVNEDCYGDGWIAVVAVPNDEEHASLLDAKAYQEHLRERDA